MSRMAEEARHGRARRSGAGRRAPASDGEPGPPPRVLCAVGWDGGSGPPSPGAHATGLWRGLAGAFAKADAAKPPGLS